jgi:hypothetical protein
MPNELIYSAPFQDGVVSMLGAVTLATTGVV